MKVYHIDHQQIPDLEGSVACIGYFDGFHLGHQALIQATLQKARSFQLPSTLITFDPDPWTLFHPDRPLDHITPLEDKVEMTSLLGIDNCLILHFTKDFAALDTEAFHKVLFQLQIKYLVCGFDFHYGYKNSGDIQTLKDQDLFSVEVVEKIEDRNGKISSTRIEENLKQGQVLYAAQMLGFAYSLEGYVVHGFHRGSSLLNIPTANIELNKEYIIPKDGVYSGLVALDDKLLAAMINIGTNPTFRNTKKTIEVHILDFDQSLYGKTLRVFFVDCIRPEMRFNGFEALKVQLHKDIGTTASQLQQRESIVSATALIWHKKPFME